MPTTSPLHHLHEQADASFVSYGTDAHAPTAQVVETFGQIEAEYAAIRKGCALIDMPQRGTIRVTGADRLDFLNRMLTADLKSFDAFAVRRSFWLNRSGRIDADLRLVSLPEAIVFDLDLPSADATVASLSSFIFSEDVVIENATEDLYRLTLHGPTARALLARISAPADAPTPPAIESIENEHASVVTIGARPVIVARDDVTGEPGLHLLVETAHVPEVYNALVDAGADATPDGTAAPGPYRLHRAGWHAYNIARIEAGTPLFNLDFAANNLPAETGVLDDRVSFTKGCYLGQEIVARMKSLGHAKQALVALRVDTPAQDASAPSSQPVTGASLFLPDDESRKSVGAVTSSTLAPMLGNACICFAQVKWDHSDPGTTLCVETDAGPQTATVQDSLSFLNR